MIAFEVHARWLLVVHTLLGVALVASSTHLVIWMRGYLRGAFNRHRAVRRFSRITAALFVTTFVFGNVVYPTYKVRVRTEYLESPSAVVKDQEQRRAAHARLIAGENQRRRIQGQSLLSGSKGSAQLEAPRVPGSSKLPKRTAKIARWFDVKEHWAALGMIMSIALMFIVTAWDPRKYGENLATLVFLIALGTSATTWIGALIGIVVSSYRSVGPIG